MTGQIVCLCFTGGIQQQHQSGKSESFCQKQHVDWEQELLYLRSLVRIQVLTNIDRSVLSDTADTAASNEHTRIIIWDLGRTFRL